MWHRGRDTVVAWKKSWNMFFNSYHSIDGAVKYWNIRVTKNVSYIDWILFQSNYQRSLRRTTTTTEKKLYLILYIQMRLISSQNILDLTLFSVCIVQIMKRACVCWLDDIWWWCCWCLCCFWVFFPEVVCFSLAHSFLVVCLSVSLPLFLFVFFYTFVLRVHAII